MSNNTATVQEVFEDGTAIDKALKDAARDARRLHKAMGNPMATWKDGQVVWVQPRTSRSTWTTTGPTSPTETTRSIRTNDREATVANESCAASDPGCHSFVTGSIQTGG